DGIENLRELPVGDLSRVPQVIVEDASAGQLDPSLLNRYVIVDLRDGVLFPGICRIVIDPSVAGKQRSGEDAVAVEQYGGNVTKLLFRVRRNGWPSVGGRIGGRAGAGVSHRAANPARFSGQEHKRRC